MEGSQSSSVVPSFSIGKKKREEDIAKRVEEAEEYYRKCVDDANLRQLEKEKTRVSIFCTAILDTCFLTPFASIVAINHRRKKGGW